MLKDIYPQYQEGVAFFAIGIDPFESLADLEAFRTKESHPWPVAVAAPASDIFSDYRVVIRSTKIGVDRHGVITFRAGYGVEEEATWHTVLQELAS